MASLPSQAPLVSVIVATYRCDKYLQLALASILAQTHADFELLVADDGGEDATRAVAESFHDPRLIYYRNPVRLGAAGNHWAAIRRARGEFIAILNHDDLWERDFLRQALTGLADERVVVAFSDFAVIDPEGRFLSAETESLSQHTRRATLSAGVHQPFADLAIIPSVPTAQAAVFRKSAIDLHDLPPEVGPAYDAWLNFLLARGGGGAFYIPARLASWRTHCSSITADRANVEWRTGGAYWTARMASHPLFVAFRRSLSRRATRGYASAAYVCLRLGRAAEARRYAWQAVRLDPLVMRTLIVGILLLLPRPLLRLLPAPEAGSWLP